jgi:3-deoxy-manno-octulosonate cytidylyltransferase (CMP-KDO synthetase)
MIIIPARVGSSRFPRKVLEPINGEPMVIKTAKVALGVDNTVIATDSRDVIEIAKDYNIRAVLTSLTHKSGTDRVYEAVRKLDLDNSEPIVNLQADEPFIEEEVIRSVLNLTKKSILRDDILINSCYKEIDEIEADNPNIVKVVTDSSDIALYFSRSKIPFIRDRADISYKAHIGVYGFTKRSLEIFCNLSYAPIEDIEKLEQLRALHFGYKIAMVGVETQSFGIDTREDLKRALEIFT